MSLPIPNNREQVYLSKVIDKNLENIPIPISRFEIYLKCLLDFDKENLPAPISKQELILYDYILGNECNVSASNKTEMFLKALSTVEVAGLPTPQSKIDVFLDYIIRNGCLEKFEYYPFSIWNYLNVKNTPKAPMKFKSMKGNTLVNLARAVNLTIDDKSPTTNNIPFNSVQGFQAGKKYTIICKFEGYKGTKPIKFRQRKYDTSWNYEFNTLIKDFSDGIKITVYTPTQDFKDVALYIDYVDEKDTSVSISDVIILEGDHTQNPPNGYIEGMKSFGDGANEIEVLSDNNLQGELNQSSKATLMYRNSSNELVPIPILRGKWEGDRFIWGDEILLHEDGKLYYHKRCFVKNFIDGLNWYNDSNSQLGENLISFAYDADSNIKVGTRICSDKYNEITSSTVSEGLFCSTSKNGIRIKINKSKCTDLKSLDVYIRNNNFSVVVELAKEEVYPCELTEQLYSYDGETNIFINGGAVVGETIIEVGTKLGPIVDSIRQDVNRSTRAIEGLMSGGIQECAYQLYPEDFENVPNTIEGEINA